MTPSTTLRQIKAFDEQRPGFPGEHWLVLGTGLGVWLLSRRSRSMATRSLGMLAASALVARAASGREGLSKALRWLPVGGGVRRF
jgi:hypothetical protein